MRYQRLTTNLDFHIFLVTAVQYLLLAVTLLSCSFVTTERPDGKTLSTFPSFIMVLLGHVLGPFLTCGSYVVWNQQVNDYMLTHLSLHMHSFGFRLVLKV
jgi:hypothetical protein